MDSINENITALVDNEINDSRKINELNKAISENEDLLLEYNIQSSVKNLLKERFAGQKAPLHLRESVIQSTIKSYDNPVAEPKPIFDIWSIFKSPQFAFATLIIIAAVFYFTGNSNVDPVKLFNQQSGNFNMAVQAERNFESIMKGELTVQLASNNPEELKAFFKENGVDYVCSIPTFDDWNLVGAVVSEDKGKKFAHHVYAGDDGQILYLYQVQKKYLTSTKILDLSNDMMDYLSDGNIVKVDKVDHNTFLWMSGENVFSLVSNESISKIENKFLAGFL